MTTLTDEELARLLDETAATYDVPEQGRAEILAALQDAPERTPLVRRRWLQLSSAAGLTIAGLVAIAMYGGGPSGTEMSATSDRDAGNLSGAAGGGTDGGVAQSGGGGSLDRFSGAATGGGTAIGGSTGGSVPQPAQLTSKSALQDSARRKAPAPVQAAAPVPVTGAVGTAAADGAESRVVKTGSISLVVKDGRVTPVISAVQKAAQVEGGYVSASTSDEFSDSPSGQVTVRVPVARFESLVAKIRALDAKVRTAQSSGKDVTAQFSDIETQLRTLKATRERFLVILGRTKTIQEILTVQQRVDDVSGQIDRLEGSRKLLASQSDLSTLTVSVSESSDPVIAVERSRSGLGEALRDAKNGFVGGVESIVRHSGGVLLWLIVLTVLGLAVRAGWKVARRTAL